MASARCVSSSSGINPFVTLAIPTFNRASWLRDCVLSALAQSYPDFEVVISDNASTDNTQDVLREFRANNKVRIIRQSENIGLLPNWNACLAHARGQYIVFVSDDDRIAPWLLERCIEIVRIEPTVPIVLALSQNRLHTQGYAIPAKPSRKLATGIWDGPDVLSEYLAGNISVQMCTIMMRTEALRVAGGFPLDLPYSGDVATWAQLLFEGKAGLVNEQCGTFASHESSETSRLSVELRLENDRTLINRIQQAADRRINDSCERSAIKSHAQGYFAGSAIWTITAYRRSGAKLSEALPVVWRCRHDLRHVALRDISRLARLVAMLLVPRSAPNWFRRLKGSLRSKPALEASSSTFQP